MKIPGYAALCLVHMDCLPEAILLTKVISRHWKLSNAARNIWKRILKEIIQCSAEQKSNHFQNRIVLAKQLHSLPYFGVFVQAILPSPHRGESGGPFPSVISPMTKGYLSLSIPMISISLLRWEPAVRIIFSGPRSVRWY